MNDRSVDRLIAHLRWMRRASAFGLVAIAYAFLSRSAMASDLPQCVVPKSIVRPDRLEIVGTRIYAAPGSARPAFVLKENIPLWAVEKQGKWLKLSGATSSGRYKDGEPVGWALESEIDYQAIRNCTL